MKTPAKTKDSKGSSNSASPFFNKPARDSFFSEGKEAETSFFPTTNIQPKLTVGQAGDKYEQEADRVADHVMRQGDAQTVQAQPMEEEEEMLQPKVQLMEEEEEAAQPKLQRQPVEEEEEMLQAKWRGVAERSTENLAVQLSQSKGGGSTLPSSTMNQMSRSIGADFSHVHVHTDAKAAEMNSSLNARAFTHGNDIYFNKGEYNPQSQEGQKLLAHELTHTIQQGAVQRKMIQRDVEFNAEEEAPVVGNASGYEDHAISDLGIVTNTVSSRMNAYGLEVHSAIAEFERYATRRITTVGADVPGAGFLNSVISIALAAVPIPGAGALLRVVGQALQEAIISEVRAKFTEAAQGITAGTNTDNLTEAVASIATSTNDIATGMRDRATDSFENLINPIITKLNNRESLTSQQTEIVGMFYRASPENRNYYLTEFFGIPAGDSLIDVQVGVYRNLVRAFEAQVLRSTGSTQQYIYWSTMARGRESGVEAYGRHVGDREAARRRRQLEESRRP